MLKCLHGILFSLIFELQTKANEMIQNKKERLEAINKLNAKKELENRRDRLRLSTIETKALINLSELEVKYI